MANLEKEIVIGKLDSNIIKGFVTIFDIAECAIDKTKIFYCEEKLILKDSDNEELIFARTVILEANSLNALKNSKFTIFEAKNNWIKIS